MFKFEIAKFHATIPAVPAPLGSIAPTRQQFFEKWGQHIIECNFTIEADDARISEEEEDNMQANYWALLNRMYVNIWTWTWRDLANACVLLNQEMRGFCILSVVNEDTYESRRAWKGAKNAFRMNVEKSLKLFD